jgi:flagellin-like protein
MGEKGLSPIIATVLLIAITMAAISPVVWWLAEFWAPFRPRFVELAVYAGLINENIVRFHIQHVAGETIRFELDKPTTETIRGWAEDPEGLRENEFYCWTFENPAKFRQSDWAYAEVQIRGANFRVGKEINVRIWGERVGLLYNGEVRIDHMDQIPGG